jgi:hypothetical protein
LIGRGRRCGGFPSSSSESRDRFQSLIRKVDAKSILIACNFVPVCRDNIGTDEELGLPTTAGSFALLGMPVKKDAFIVRKLRQAGAISEYFSLIRLIQPVRVAVADERDCATFSVMAKANMSELADYKSGNAGPGWSAVGGQTINVYVSRICCLVFSGRELMENVDQSTNVGPPRFAWYQLEW